MKNLAGNKDCDLFVADELRRARIESGECVCQTGEVPSLLQGNIGEIRFLRAWTYWTARGPVPISIARQLYADPVGMTDVRVAGHCGCPAPEAPWTELIDGEEFVTSYHIDTEVGLRLFADTLRAAAGGAR